MKQKWMRLMKVMWLKKKKKKKKKKKLLLSKREEKKSEEHVCRERKKRRERGPKWSFQTPSPASSGLVSLLVTTSRE